MNFDFLFYPWMLLFMAAFLVIGLVTFWPIFGPLVVGQKPLPFRLGPWRIIATGCAYGCLAICFFIAYRHTGIAIWNMVAWISIGIGLFMHGVAVFMTAIGRRYLI